MKKCPNCGAQMNDDSLFCTECGTPIPQGNVCSHCGALVNNGDAFCQNCGKNTAGDSAPNVSFQAQAPYATRNNSQSNFILPIVIGGIFLVVLILAGGGWWYYKSFKNSMNNETLQENTIEKVETKMSDEEESAKKDFIETFYKGLLKSDYDYSYIKKHVSPKALQLLKDEYDYECEDGDCLGVWLFAYEPGTDIDWSKIMSRDIKKESENRYLVEIKYKDAYYGIVKYNVLLTITKDGNTYKIDDNSLFCTECGKQIPQGNICSHCGALVNNDDAFCQNCGNKVDGGEGQQPSAATAPDQKHCPHCGAATSNDSLFCENCGRNLADGSPAPNMNFQPQVPYETGSSSQSKMILPIITIAGLLIIAIAGGGGWWYYNSFKPKTSDLVVAYDSIADDVQEVFAEDVDSVDSIEEVVEGDIVIDTVAVDMVVMDDSQHSDAITEHDATTAASAKATMREQEERQPQQSETSNKVYETVEQMPSFPGGDAALMRFLSSNVHYPVEAEENGIQGRVVVTFIIERDGSITNVEVLKRVDPSLDKEAVRVVQSMPRWRAGTQNGEPVRVKYTMPVIFRLQ